MDQEKVRHSAQNLEDQLTRYSVSDSDVQLLSESLRSLLDRAKTGELVTPVQFNSVPGEYFFTEKDLSKYSDLEEAYSKFKICITVGDLPATQKALELIGSFRIQ